MDLRQKYLERFPGSAEIGFHADGTGTAVFPNGQTINFEMDAEDIGGGIVYMESPKQIVGETIFIYAAGAGLLLWLLCRKH